MVNIVDAIKGFFSAESAFKSARFRALTKAANERTYDIFKSGRKDSNWFRPETTGAQELTLGFKKAAATGQELCRNNPLAHRIKTVWTGNIVGSGIKLEITGGSELKNKKINKIWNKLAESTDIDFEGHNNFYGLQALWSDTLVETGGVFIRRHVARNKDFPLQLQTFEQTLLDTSKNGSSKDGKQYIDGVQYNKLGQVDGYWLLKDVTNTGLNLARESEFYPSSEIIHIFKKDRAGQHLGMTMFHSVATTINDYSILQEAKLMQQQIAACFGVIIEGADTPTSTDVKTKGTSTMPDSFEPGMIEYTEAGQKVHTVSPPRVDASSKFDIDIKRNIAAGVGITYEQLTGDYSLVNFASGRMGKTEFFNQLDMAQHLTFEPKLDRIVGWFFNLYEVKTGISGDFESDWTFPARAAVNPQEEFDVLMSKVRHAMISPTKAAKTLGSNLTKVIEQWKKDKNTFGTLPFDIDPSKFASTGNQLDDNDAASSNSTTNPKKAKGKSQEQKEKDKESESASV